MNLQLAEDNYSHKEVIKVARSPNKLFQSRQMHKVKTKHYTLTAYVNAQRQIVRVITCDYCFGNLRHTPYIEHYFDGKSFNQ